MKGQTGYYEGQYWGTGGGKRWYEATSEEGVWDLRPEGREGACEEGRRASEAKATRWEGARGGETLSMAEVR